LAALSSKQIFQSRAAGDCTVSDTDIAMDSEEKRLFDLINTFRQQNGVPPLKEARLLDKAAAWHVNDSFAHNILARIDSLGRDGSLTDTGF
jgi:uncharacterized protein YkwD